MKGRKRGSEARRLENREERKSERRKKGRRRGGVKENRG